MGWTTAYRSGQSHWDYFQEAWGKDFEILECSPNGFKFLHLAIKSMTTQKVFAVVITHEWRKSRHGIMEYCYRDDDESCGPLDYPPENVLMRLTPAEGEFAIEWRKKAWERIERRRSISLKVGDEIEFDSPLRFVDHAEHNRMKVTCVKPLRLNNYYRVSHLRDHKFKVFRNGKEVQPKERGGMRLNSREFEFQFDFGQADWSRIENDPSVFLKDKVIRSFEHSFGRNYFVYRIKDSNEYSIVTRTRNTQWCKGKPITLYKHSVISQDTFQYLKRVLLATKLGA